MKWTRWRSLAVLSVGALMATAIVARPPVQGDEKKSADPAVERTRKQVRMLDDLYKHAIVLITEHYVNDETGLAAGDAFQALFQGMKDKGWHEVRLLDATGEPYDDDNSPRDDFEKSAVTRLKNGDTFVETEFIKDGKRYFRAATPIPVVMDKCVLCHAHYEDVPKGQAIGALAYVLPVE